MGRTIDADVLKSFIRAIPDTSGLGLEPVIAMRDVLEMIDHVPTIPAISVDWIFEQMQILHELHNKNEYVLQWLMELWQREQEVR